MIMAMFPWGAVGVKRRRAKKRGFGLWRGAVPLALLATGGFVLAAILSARIPLEGVGFPATIALVTIAMLLSIVVMLERQPAERDA